MRVLLDTNVLIAAFIARATQSELLEHCARNHTLISSKLLLREFKDLLVLERFRRIPILAPADFWRHESF